MRIIDFIDLESLFNEIKKKHLKKYPDIKDYKKFLKKIGAKNNHAKSLYYFLNNRSIDNMDIDNSCESEGSILMGIIKYKLIKITFEVGENNSNEQTNYNYSGFGFQFVIDLNNEIFIDYKEENYG